MKNFELFTTEGHKQTFIFDFRILLGQKRKWKTYIWNLRIITEFVPTDIKIFKDVCENSSLTWQDI